MERAGIHAELHLSGTERRLPPDTELALFRITQEALRNVERHAEATHVGIDIAFAADGVRLDIADDGRGFVPAEPRERFAQAGKLGLLGMQERARLIGARLSIRSHRGEGSTVIVSVDEARGD